MRRWLLATWLTYAIPVFALAHDHANPELDNWFKGLKNGHNQSCCDGSDALSILEPDWDMADNHYRVRQSPRHQWLVVPHENLVKEKNKAGVAKVWPTIDAAGTWTTIRCFLPGFTT